MIIWVAQVLIYLLKSVPTYKKKTTVKTKCSRLLWRFHFYKANLNQYFHPCKIIFITDIQYLKSDWLVLLMIGRQSLRYRKLVRFPGRFPLPNG